MVVITSTLAATNHQGGMGVSMSAKIEALERFMTIKSGSLFAVGIGLIPVVLKR